MQSKEENSIKMELFSDTIKVSSDTKRMWKDYKEMFQAIIRHDMETSGKSSEDITREISLVKEFFDFIYTDSFSREKYHEYADAYIDNELSWMITEIEGIFSIGISSEEEFLEVLDYFSKKYSQYDAITDSVEYLYKTVKGGEDYVFNYWEAFTHGFSIAQNENLDFSDYRTALYCQRYISDGLEEYMTSKS